MSRSLSLAVSLSLAALSYGCASVDAHVDDPASESGAAAGDASGAASGGVEPDASRIFPPITVDVGGRCDPSLESRPHNTCDGEEMLGLDLVSIRDANGDGVWSQGEELMVNLELFSTHDVDDGWINYPGVFVDPPEGAEQAGFLSGEQAVTWFYGIWNDSSYPVTAVLVAHETVEPGSEIIFTVGSLNCIERGWHDCPVPSPLRVTIGG